jgi:hypothetical protein
VLRHLLKDREDLRGRVPAGRSSGALKP